MGGSRIEVSPDAAGLAGRVAQWIADLACHDGGRFSICLSGGSTPKRLYQILATAPLREQLPWQHIHWFWGDERFVPWDHPDSNYGMAREAMLAHVPVPPENIHGFEVKDTLGNAARAYERVLKSYYGAEMLDPSRPLFDVMLLGMGPDGHTASLFPGKPALQERHRWAIEVPEPGLNPHVPRITLTYPALDSCRSAAFLVAGADKTEKLKGALAGQHDLPSGQVRPVGELVWFVDQAARG
jgi:6-phosphogluconolactonase